jgi:hypothetical protein
MLMRQARFLLRAGLWWTEDNGSIIEAVQARPFN